jgi:primosomal protein N' (replication factor Y)
MAAVDGPASVLGAFLEAARLPPTADALGPVPLPARPADRSAQEAGDDAVRQRLLLRVPWQQGRELATALSAAKGVLDARTAAAGLRVQLDPLTLG